ncbi:tetratricopeptide repeat protein [bacterium]|nr:tetratricopeptide repeat protein [bacterium]
MEKLSAAVGGHPLALRLLAPIFEEQARLSLEAFIGKLQTFLPKASDQWTEQHRHESLGACFAFSMDNLPKNEEGEKLRVAISRLGVFTAFFASMFVSPVIANKWPEAKEEEKEQDENAERISHALWERGLLERAIIELEEGNFYLYRLHPALVFFAKEHLTNADAEGVKKNYLYSMGDLARVAEEQITNNPLIAQVVYRAIPDLLIAAESGNDIRMALMQFRVSNILQLFGLYDVALQFSEKSCEIYESLNQQRDKAVVIGEMAKIYEVRGNLDKGLELHEEKLAIVKDLGDKREEAVALHQIEMNYLKRGNIDGAMKFHQPALEIVEELGDLQGKCAILHNMAHIYVTRGDLDRAINLYQETLEIFEGLEDLRGQGVTLHEIAGIYMARGDLNDAMKFYQKSLDIAEALGDLKSRATTLNNIGILLLYQKRFVEALKSLLSALEIRIQLQTKLDIQSTISSINKFRQTIGINVFRKIWEEVTGSEHLPEWVNQPLEEQIAAEQFIAGAIQSAREKRPEAEEYFKSAQKMAADSSVPAEMRELGRVLQRIMIGDKNVDLSSLPKEWAELVKKELRG